MRAPTEALTTFSQLDRGMACLASLVLPRSDNETVWSDDGHKKHAALEAATLGARYEDIRARAPDTMSDAELLALVEAWAAFRKEQRLVPISGFPLAEVTLGVDPINEVVRLVGAGLGRKYVSGPGELVGTADYFWLQDGVLTVLDLKFGNPRNGKNPKTTWQLRGLGTTLWQWFDRPPAGCNLMLWYPREGLKPRTYHATPMEMEGWIRDEAAWMRVAGRVVTGELDAEPQRNPECFFCPSKPHCPLWRNVNGKWVYVPPTTVLPR